MERNDSSSDSDERMKKRFGFELSRDKSEDDEEDEEQDSKEKASKEREKKTPSKSLFFGGRGRTREADGSDVKSENHDLSEREPKDSEQRQALLRLILGQETSTEKAKSDAEKSEDFDEGEDKGSEADSTIADVAEDGVQLEASEEHDDTVETGADTQETERLEAELQEIVEGKIEKIHSEMSDVMASDDDEVSGTAEAGKETASDMRAAELAADMGFLEKVSEKIKSGIEAPAAIEESVAESLAEPDIDSDAIAENEEIGAGAEALDSENPELSEADQAVETDDLVTASPAAAPLASSAAAGAAASLSGASRTTPTTASRSSSSPSPTPSTYASASGTPPLTPLRPRMPAAPAAYSYYGPGPNSASYPTFNPNILAAPAANDNDTETVRVNDVYRRNRNTGKLILAGLIGYAIGRRGGRKRTERRLQPEIDKGQKQVKELEQKLEFSEQSVREKAAETVRLRDDLSERTQQKAAAETGQQRVEERMRAEKDLAQTATSPEASAATPLPPEQLTPLQAQILSEQGNRTPSDMLAEVIKPPRPETSLGKELLRAPLLAVAAAEALPKDVQTERILREENAVLQAENDPALAVETATTPPVVEAVRLQPLAPEISKAVSGEVRKKAVEQNVEAPKVIDAQTMTMPELLNVAEKIDVGSGNLKDMYEHKRIDAVNLRRVVAEYAAGKNYKETLQRSLEAEEMHRELRNEVKTDDSVSGQAAAVAVASTPSAQTVLANQAQTAVTSKTDDMPNPAATEQFRPLDIPPPSTSFMPELARNMYTSSDDEDPDSSSSAMSSAVVIAIGVLVGAVLAGILLLAFGIV